MAMEAGKGVADELGVSKRASRIVILPQFAAICRYRGLSGGKRAGRTDEPPAHATLTREPVCGAAHGGWGWPGAPLWSAPARHCRDGAFPWAAESGVTLRLPPQSIVRAVWKQRGAPTPGGPAVGGSGRNHQDTEAGVPQLDGASNPGLLRVLAPARPGGLPVGRTWTLQAQRACGPQPNVGSTASLRWVSSPP